MPTPEFDVFLSHNSKDKTIVAELAERLKARSLKVWLDMEQLVPGRSFQEGLEHIIETTASAAILVGPDGLGPWEVPEMRACLQEFAQRSLPVIPVLLPGASKRPELPLFLREFTWVDMRLGITGEQVDRLCWGITGVKAVEISRALVVSRARHEIEAGPSQVLDVWGIASVKSRLHALSEVVAQAAAEQAAVAAAKYQEDILSILVPITFEMRWRRGYLAAIERILKIPQRQARLANFTCEEVPGGCTTTEGVLSARVDDDGRIVVMLDDQPALFVADVPPEQQADVTESVNLHGRLGVPSQAGLSLVERIGEIPVRHAAPVADALATALFQNRTVLAALIARHQMPGADWLLPQEEDAFDKREDVGAGTGSAPRPYAARKLRSDLISATHSLAEETFDARTLAKPPGEQNPTWGDFAAALPAPLGVDRYGSPVPFARPRPTGPSQMSDDTQHTSSQTSTAATHLPKGDRRRKQTRSASPAPGQPSENIALDPDTDGKTLGILVVDSTGAETFLPEYGIYYRPSIMFGIRPTLDGAERDGFLLEEDNATQEIPWSSILRITMQNEDAATVELRDGQSIGPVKPRPGTVVGADEHGFDFTLFLSEVKTISLTQHAPSQTSTAAMHLEKDDRRRKQARSASPASGRPARNTALDPDTDGKTLGILVVDSTGAETLLLEYGIFYRPFMFGISPTLDGAARDGFILEKGSATQVIPWNSILRITMQDEDAATVELRDGRFIGPVTPRSGAVVVGTDELGFDFMLHLPEVKTISLTQQAPSQTSTAPTHLQKGDRRRKQARSASPAPGRPFGNTALDPDAYAKTLGILVVDSTDAETLLIEYGIFYRPIMLGTSPTLDEAARDGFVLQKGSATQVIPWSSILRITMQNEDAATVELRDGQSIGPVTPRPGVIMGTDEHGFDFTLHLSEVKAISLAVETSAPEWDALLRDIPDMVRKSQGAYTASVALDPQQDYVLVTIRSYFNDEPRGSQTFQMPGPSDFRVDGNGYGGFFVAVHAQTCSINLGTYDRQTANTLAKALTRLNTLSSSH